MSKPLKVAFVTTCKGRVQHLRETLVRNLHDNSNALCVVLAYNCSETVKFLSHFTQAIAGGKLVVYEYKEPVPFAMAHAKNMAHRCALREGADILVNVDADNYVGKGFDHYVAEQFKTNPNAYLWSRMIKDGDGRLPRGISGRIAVSRIAFLMAGGYDERYSTHSPDDKDFNARLSLLGFEGQEIDPCYLQAILHNDRMRYREYPHAKHIGEDSFCVNPQSGIANSGRVGCGTVYRNFSDEPIEIKPIPTRVFGIGMHKTGTTSLHEALTILGYRSGHWTTAKWAKHVWRQVMEKGTSYSLDQVYAASDLPMPLLFRQLDAAYPGAKFILTVRDEWKWLKSVSNHWNPDINPYRNQWDTDAFSHRVHNLLYGRKDFDPTTMLNRYRSHNEEVIAYFKDRPNDLLVMDLEKNCGFPELCAFLGVPIPDVPYPKALPTKEINTTEPPST